MAENTDMPFILYKNLVQILDPAPLESATGAVAWQQNLISLADAISDIASNISFTSLNIDQSSITDVPLSLNLALNATANAFQVVSGDGSTILAKIDPVGSITANSFIGNGSLLTNLNASNITTGTINAARLPSLSGTYLSIGGGILTGSLTAVTFIGDGSQLTGISGGGNSYDQSLNTTDDVAFNTIISDRVLIGGASDDGYTALQVNGYLIIGSLDTHTINGTTTGQFVTDSTTGVLRQWNGTAWHNVGAAAGTFDGTTLTFNTGATIDDNGTGGFYFIDVNGFGIEIDAANGGLITATGNVLDNGSGAMSIVGTIDIQSASGGIHFSNGCTLQDDTYGGIDITDTFTNTTLNFTNGTVTAGYFVGDGSGLTNLPGGGGNPFNQSLDTTDSPTFDTLTLNGNASLSSGDYILFNGSADTNWRIGLGINAFTTSIVGATTSIQIVTGAGSSGPDGFAIGNANGQSIMELDGSSLAALFGGDVTVGGTLFFAGGGTPYIAYDGDFGINITDGIGNVYEFDSDNNGLDIGNANLYIRQGIYDASQGQYAYIAGEFTGSGYSTFGGLRLNGGDTINSLYNASQDMGITVDDGQTISIGTYSTYSNAIVIDGPNVTVNSALHMAAGATGVDLALSGALQVDSVANFASDLALIGSLFLGNGITAKSPFSSMNGVWYFNQSGTQQIISEGEINARGGMAIGTTGKGIASNGDVTAGAGTFSGALSLNTSGQGVIYLGDGEITKQSGSGFQFNSVINAAGLHNLGNSQVDGFGSYAGLLTTTGGIAIGTTGKGWASNGDVAATSVTASEIVFPGTGGNASFGYDAGGIVCLLPVGGVFTVINGGFNTNNSVIDDGNGNATLGGSLTLATIDTSSLPTGAIAVDSTSGYLVFNSGIQAGGPLSFNDNISCYDNSATMFFNDTSLDLNGALTFSSPSGSQFSFGDLDGTGTGVFSLFGAKLASVGIATSAPTLSAGQSQSWIDETAHTYNIDWVESDGTPRRSTLPSATGATGSFTTVDGKTVTVTKGIITSIV